MSRIETLDEFILKQQGDHTESSGSFSRLLRDIGIAAKIVNREVNKAGLVNILGVEGSQNSTGDEVQKLDVFANEKFIETLSMSGEAVSYTHLRAHETVLDIVCRLLLDKKKNNTAHTCSIIYIVYNIEYYTTTIN